jgi:hypothetical protein
VTQTVAYAPALANPDLAYDASSGRYLMVFYAAGAVRGVYLDRNGNAVSSQFIIDYGSIFNPRVASDGNGHFLALYSTEQSGTFRRRVKVLDASGTVTPAAGVGPTGLVVAEGADFALTHRPGLAWNATLGYFQTVWSMSVGGGVGQVGTYVTGVRLDGTMAARTLVANPFVCGGGEYLKHTLPEIAVAADGSALVVGYRDSTSDACKPFGGLWFQALSSAGTPTGSTGAVQGTSDTDLHREHRIAYNSVLNTYQVVWARSGSILSSVYGQRFDGTGARLGSAYLVRGPVPFSGSNGAVGQVGMAYDPEANQFEIAVRVNDTGNGLSPVSRFRLNADGSPKSMTPVRIESGAFDPWPVVVADGTGRFMIMYRLSYETRIALTPILP